VAPDDVLDLTMFWIYGDEPNGLASFLLLSLALAGAGAYATGRALAKVWQPFWLALIYVILLVAAERFLHFALFHEPLWAPWLCVVDYGLGLSIAAFAYYRTRARQMAQHYGFLAAGAGESVGE
jgi:hypothetical protein